MIYLDNAATTYPKPEKVLEALDEANRNAFNAGRGGYTSARESTLLIDKVRQKLLDINNIKEGNVILLPSATIALNSIIFGLSLKKGDNVYVSPFEHNSIMRALYELKNRIDVVNVYQRRNDLVKYSFWAYNWSKTAIITLN